ncbi:hypothetical protein V8G54_030383 [Vigna mungo]|uniref:Uncharacterized protein n=1 Tax=Vigna mungo TaxID=3915 RepID=A0AAQ3RMC7_VIGMU
MVRPVAPGGEGPGRNEPVRERISKRPWRAMTAPGAVGWRRVTFTTAPLPLRMDTPRWRLRANWTTQSVMSAPLAISMTWLRIALGLSRVTNIGGLGLFLEPGGRPLGRRVLVTSIAPSLGSSLFSFSSSSSPAWFAVTALSFMENPRSGFLMESPEFSRPTEPVHQRLAIT